MGPQVGLGSKLKPLKILIPLAGTTNSNIRHKGNVHNTTRHLAAKQPRVMNIAAATNKANTEDCQVAATTNSTVRSYR